jgi:UDP-N-acetylglucosamine--N-acetylmuramyl-(pentapeptide) pyrophosphoryl-undecaprenol N-acetylglucosamine transferase
VNVLLTGGGTGGHVYPALAIAEALGRRREAAPLNLLFAGSRDRLEATIVPAAGVPIEFLAGAPLARRNPLAFAKTVARNLIGVAQALALLHRFQPDCVVATGGYVSFPVVVAMRLVRAIGRSAARIGLLEPNVTPGLTNRLLAPLADEVWLAHRPAGGVPPGRVLTGTPVRESFRRSIPPADARRALGLDPGKTTIVVFGGSQGARSINETIDRIAGDLPSGWQIFHVSGTADGGSGAVRTVRYVDDPRPAYAAADIVVARAGASTLAEIAASGVPSILIPYPFATDDHQMHNAQRFAQSGAARIITDAELTPARLIAELQSALDPQTLAVMRASSAAMPGQDSATLIADRILTLCGGSSLSHAKRALS